MKNVTCYPYAIGGRKKERRKHDTFELFQRELFLRTSSVKRSEERGGRERETKNFRSKFPKKPLFPPPLISLNSDRDRRRRRKTIKVLINRPRSRTPSPSPRKKFQTDFYLKTLSTLLPAKNSSSFSSYSSSRSIEFIVERFIHFPINSNLKF